VSDGQHFRSAQVSCNVLYQRTTRASLSFYWNCLPCSQGDSFPHKSSTERLQLLLRDLLDRTTISIPLKPTMKPAEKRKQKGSFFRYVSTEPHDGRDEPKPRSAIAHLGRIPARCRPPGYCGGVCKATRDHKTPLVGTLSLLFNPKTS
jgi:hypothetical protein